MKTVLHAHRVVGVSDACDFPVEATSLHQVLRWRAATASSKGKHENSNVSGDSPESSAVVMEPGACGPAPLVIDTEWLARQAPGLVLVQGACGPGDADASLVTQVRRVS